MDKMVIVSYVPLLFGEGGEKIDISTSDKINEFASELMKHDYGQVDACLWAANTDGTISPVFVMPRAKEIAQHLSMWAEDQPQEWFEVCLLDKVDTYFIILWPDLEKSKERHIYNWMIKNQEIVIEKNTEFSFIVKPLYFRSGNRGTLDKVLELVKDMSDISIGFLDKEDFNMSDPLSTQIEPYYLDSFKLQFKHDQADAYCDSVLA